MSEVFLSCSELGFGYGDKTILDGFSLELRSDRVTGIIGPNGGGKTTLFRLLSGYLAPQKGRIFLRNRPLETYSARERARELAMLPQELEVNFPFRVREVVYMGRTAHMGRFSFPGAADRAAVDEALAEMDLTALAKRRFAELSGGERRRTLIAAALAQNAGVLLLDEPTAALDMGHAAALMRRLTQLARERHLAVAVVSHDIELLGRYADRLLLFQHGRVLCDGAPGEVLTPELISAAYELKVDIVPGLHGERLISYR